MTAAKKTPAMKEQPLFGAVDQVINTLELEIRLVKDEIEKCHRAIESKTADKEDLEGRLKNLVDSMTTVRKDRPKKAKP